MMDLHQNDFQYRSERTMFHWKKTLGRFFALIFAAVFAALLLLPGKTSAAGGGTLTVSFLDVGQADSALAAMQDPDGSMHYMLIDGGNKADSQFLYAWLKNHGISELEYIVCTHAHEDHAGGLAGALNAAKADTALAPVSSSPDSKAFTDFVKYLNKQGVQITVPTPGQSFSLGQAQFQILGPVSPSDNKNNTSLVLRLSYGSTSFLFTGDMEREEEEEVLASGLPLASDVLKVGHHGSDTSTSYLFLRTVNPKYAVISVGAGNSYGLPTENVLSRLRDAGVQTYRTDLQGTVTAVSDGSAIAFAAEKNSTADTLAGAGAGQNAAPADPAGSQAGTYVLNTNTHKFHYPSCSSVGQMKEKNKKVVSESREQIISEGYSPCKNCNP